MKTGLLCCLLAWVSMSYAEDDYKITFTATSVKSHIFAPLRANKSMVLINECGKPVTDSYGILEQAYVRGSVENDKKCTWNLHAPEGHVVNIISILFILENGTSKPNIYGDIKTTRIAIYDGKEATSNKLLTEYYLTPQERVGAFVQSISSMQDMVVEVKYHDNKDFAIQRMLINYEFLDYEKMMALLRDYKG